MSKHGKPLPGILRVSPAIVPAHSQFGISGSGFTPGAGIQVNLYAPGITSVQGVAADSLGNISGVEASAGAPGSATVEALDGSTVVARLTFQIT